MPLFILDGSKPSFLFKFFGQGGHFLVARIFNFERFIQLPHLICNSGQQVLLTWIKADEDSFKQLFSFPVLGFIRLLFLLRFLRSNNIVHGIATSGSRPEINASLDALEIDADLLVVERNDVMRAKPEPDLFLACQQRLGVRVEDCYVVGDAVWDLLAARSAGMLSIGLLSGGYGEDELSQAGAFRVYRDALELYHSLDELGVLP